MGHLGPKIAHSHNSGSAVRIVLTFCTIKGIKRDMGIALGNHISGFSGKKKKKKKYIYIYIYIYLGQYGTSS